MKKQLIMIGIAAVMVLSGCRDQSDDAAPASGSQHEEQEDMGHSDMDHSEMDMDEMHDSGSGEVPKGLKSAANPAYKVGSQVILKAGHMEGMKGAKATVVGAYDTIAYAVSYTPTTGGPKVTNHKWVIQEEIQGAGSKPFAPGDQVVILADHMKGMKGAQATIDLAEPTTVYMVDYMPTTGGQLVKNHKWVTESELSAAP